MKNCLHVVNGKLDTIQPFIHLFQDLVSSITRISFRLARHANKRKILSKLHSILSSILTSNSMFYAFHRLRFQTPHCTASYLKINEEAGKIFLRSFNFYGKLHFLYSDQYYVDRINISTREVHPPSTHILHWYIIS